ncbi:hypothetical protein ACFC1T_08895 [Kitasatospora sp. NPDC056076]|uniref:hypothetical protein n=1 Tax=Kitasatospora sp. NPDC056076 TaxID=3345703 RepID=UPI0035E16BBF
MALTLDDLISATTACTGTGQDVTDCRVKAVRKLIGANPGDDLAELDDQVVAAFDEMLPPEDGRAVAGPALRRLGLLVDVACAVRLAQVDLAAEEASKAAERVQRAALTRDLTARLAGKKVVEDKEPIVNGGLPTIDGQLAAVRRPGPVGAAVKILKGLGAHPGAR